jgi:hypothetical protein
MKNGVWVSGLVVSIAGWVSPLFGQDSTWRPPASPQPVAASALNDLRPCPAVSLGKPVCLPSGSGSATVRPASFNEPSPQSPAADASGYTDDLDKADKGSDFAIDRPIPISAALTSAVIATADGSSLRLMGMPAGNPNALGLVVPAAGATVSSPTDPPLMPIPVQEEVRYPKFYVSSEYLLWWLKQDKVPVLASTSTNPFDNGELGKPTTEVLFGGDGLNGSDRSGFRITAGWWLDETCKDDAIEIRGFYLASQATDFDANSSQFPVIARPFFNINMHEEFAQLTAFPGVGTGNLAINDESHFWGTEINARCNLCCGCNYRLDLFGGFRYLDLDEFLNITETGLNAVNAPPPFPGDRFVVTDYFGTRNQFYGGQVGFLGEYDRGPWSVEARAQIALGDTHQDILIDGSQLFTDPNGTTHSFVGGLLALKSNIGRYSADKFTYIPELDLNVGYQLTDHVRLFVGYDILYWSSVVRPGGQIDRNIDITLIPNFPVPGAVPAGQNQPAAPRPATDFWAQGLTVGVEFRY